MPASGNQPSLWVTVLAGGAGTRFWPLSTSGSPKQLLPLASGKPLIADTLERVVGLVPQERIRVLAGADLVQPIRSITDLPLDAFLVEAHARGTGPVLTRAAWEISNVDPSAVMVSMHSDHLIRPASEFRRAVRHAVDVAQRHKVLVTLAVSPDRADTGYGYIRPGTRLQAPEEATAHRVAAFVEKPGQALAQRYVREGYRWNSGIFVWPARVFLDEVRAHAPEIAAAMGHLDAGDADAFFGAVGKISVDEAVLERSGRVALVDTTFQWDDMGGWEAWARARDRDADSNVAEGAVDLVASRDNIVLASSRRIALVGVTNHLVVQTPEVTLVMSRDELPRLKEHLNKVLQHRPDPSGDGPRGPT